MASSKEELAYVESTRALDLQLANLDALRSQANVVVGALAIGTGLFVTADAKLGVAFWLGVGAFGGVVLCTLGIFWPVAWSPSLNSADLVGDYVDDEDYTFERMQRDLAIHGAENYKVNAAHLGLKMWFYVAQLVLFGLTIVLFALNLALEEPNAGEEAPCTTTSSATAEGRQAEPAQHREACQEEKRSLEGTRLSRDR